MNRITFCSSEPPPRFAVFRPWGTVAVIGFGGRHCRRRSLSVTLSAMRAALITLGVLVAVALVAMFGTIQAMEKGSPAAQYKVHLAGTSTNCAIRVTWPITN